MANKLIEIIILIFALTSGCLAQELTITSRKVIYRQNDMISENPIIDKVDFVDVAAHDWEAVTVVYPQITGLDSLLAKRIESTIDDYFLQDSLGSKPLPYNEMVGKKGQGLHDYKINYNNGELLDITFHWKLVLGHPFESFYTIVINLSDGNRVIPQDVFTNTGELVAKIKKKQKWELKQAIAGIDRYSRDHPMCSFVKKEIRGKFTAKNLVNFTINDTGITFMYNYNREYFCSGLYPQGRYFFTWKEMKSFIRPDGVFGRFTPSAVIRNL